MEKQLDENLDFFTEEDISGLKLLNMKAKQSDVKRLINNIDEERNKFIGNEELSNHIDDIIEDYPVDRIKSLTELEINNIFKVDGKELELMNINDKKKDFEFKQDFLILVREMYDAKINFGSELENIEKEIADSQEEFNKVINEFGNVSNIIRNRLNELINSEEISEDLKEKYRSYIEALDNAFNFDNVIKFITTAKGKDIIGDYRLEKRSSMVYNRYKKVATAINSTQDLSKFGGLEEKFLPEEYNVRPNIFLFSVISMISTWHNKPLKNEYILFITQLLINLKNLIFNNFETEEIKEEFLLNIKKVIDVID